MRPEIANAAGEDILALPDRLDQPAVELLLTEYEHLGASLLANEETGEKRLTVFLTVVGASIAGLGLAADQLASQPGALVTAMLVASLALLVFGLVVLRRVMERNVVTTEYVNGLRLIRAFFVRQQPELLRLLPLPPGPHPQPREKKPWWGIGKAGFLETLGATNCILAAVAAGAGAWLSRYPWPATLSLAVLAAAAAWALQMRWAQRTYAALTAKRAADRREVLAWWRDNPGSPPAPPGPAMSPEPLAPLTPPEEPEFFRAGVGLVVADASGHVLALERSRIPGAWQFPQGGLKRGESLEAAAWRELAEETGLSQDDVDLERTLDVWLGYELPPEMRSAKTRRGQVHRWFFLRLRPGAALPPLPSGEGVEFRDRRWMTPDELVRDAVPFRRPVYARVAEWVAEAATERPAE